MPLPTFEPPGSDPANESPFKGKTGLRRVWNALGYSVDGLKAAYRCEDAFRQEVWLALVLVPLALLLPVPWTQRAALVAVVLFVLVVELLNSAIEAVVDRVSLESHHLAKRAKDIGSAAVLGSLMMVAVVWAGVVVENFG
jgi:diacylglycerol kinase (ATP)